MFQYLANRRHSSSSRSSNRSSPRSLAGRLTNFVSYRGRSSSTSSSATPSPMSGRSYPSPGLQSVVSVLSDAAQHQNTNDVPFETVRALLMGDIDPVELAQQILPAKDISAVIRYNSAPIRPKLDLTSHPIVTKDDILFIALSYVGFEDRQDVRARLNNDRYFAHYKLHPSSVLDAWNYFTEYDDNGGKLCFKVFLYTLNFLKLCKCFKFELHLWKKLIFNSYSCSFLDETREVLAGRWKLSEDTLDFHIWRTLYMIQSHRDTFIYYDPNEFKKGQVPVMGVDTVTYTVNEPRTDTSRTRVTDRGEENESHKRWYDHKSHSAGVKYELGLPLCLERVSFEIVASY